jgi:hypothetical protein
MFGRLCTVINSSLNFAIYSVGGQEFKRTFKQVQRMKKYKYHTGKKRMHRIVKEGCISEQ